MLSVVCAPGVITNKKMQAYKYIIKSTGIDFITFYATTGAEKCNHQLVVATTSAFTLTSVQKLINYLPNYKWNLISLP